MSHTRVNYLNLAICYSVNSNISTEQEIDMDSWIHNIINTHVEKTYIRVAGITCLFEVRILNVVKYRFQSTM